MSDPSKEPLRPSWKSGEVRIILISIAIGVAIGVFMIATERTSPGQIQIYELILTLLGTVSLVFGTLRTGLKTAAVVRPPRSTNGEETTP